MAMVSCMFLISKMIASGAHNDELAIASIAHNNVGESLKQNTTLDAAMPQ